MKKHRVCVYLLLICSYFICQVFAGATREQMEKFGNSFRNTCLSKTGVDRSLAEQLRDGKFPEDPQVKCYARCVMSLMKTFTKQNTIDLNMMLKQISIMAASEIADSMAAAAKTCHAQTTADDTCELAFKFTKCLHDYDPSVFFFP